MAFVLVGDVLSWVVHTRIGAALLVVTLIAAVGAAASLWSWTVPAVPGGILVLVGAVWGIGRDVRSDPEASDREA